MEAPVPPTGHGPKRVEILSVRVQYNQNLSAAYASTKPYSFFQHNSQLDGNALTWYSSKIEADLTGEIAGSIFNLPHRHILTGDIEVFKFNQKTFNTVDIIFGQEKVYWRFSLYLNSGEVYVLRGETILDVGNCPCCIDKHFKRIIEALRKRYIKQNKIN